ASASAPAAAPAALAIFLQRTVVTFAPARDLIVIAFAGRFSRVFLFRLERDGFLDDRRDVFRRRLRGLRFALDTARQFAALDRVIVCAGQRVVRLDGDRDAKPPLEVAQVGALLVEDIERNRRSGAHRDIVSRAL